MRLATSESYAPSCVTLTQPESFFTRKNPKGPDNASTLRQVPFSNYYLENLAKLSENRLDDSLAVTPHTMLVLSRKKDEKIILDPELIPIPEDAPEEVRQYLQQLKDSFHGEAVEIMVVDIRGDKVRLGIQASNKVPIHRQEVHEAIQEEWRKQAEAERTDDSQ